MDKKDVYKLTNPQTSIWNMENFFEGTTINNICTTGTIYEKIDLPLLKQAINNLVEKNDSFRIRIHVKNNIPYQTIAPFKPFDIDVVHVKKESEVKKIEQEMVNYKFNIINSVLFRFKIVIFENGFCSIILNLSHIIADSWSLGITVQEILKEYHSLKNNEILPESNNSYIDYIKFEQEYKNSEKYKNDKKYWEDTFSTIPEQATIPSTKKIKSNISNKAKRKNFSLDKNLVTKINEFCKKEKLSVFNFLMAIYSLYIGRVSNLNSFVLGTPILNRTNFKDKHTTGMFVNTVPVKIDIPEDDSFVEFVHKISSNIMGALKHQKYSYNNILDDLRNKNKNIPNLYNIIISYQITKAFDEQLGNYKGNWVFNNYCGNDLDIHILDPNDTKELIFSYDYLIDKYSLSDIKNLHSRIVTMINQVLNNSKIQANEIEIVTNEEKHKIFYEFNNTTVKYPTNKTIVDLFEEQVKKTPNNIALVFGNQNLTYKELNEKANSLARYLVENNVKSNTICAVVINRSLEMIIAIWAILKAGAAYIPIDPNYPKERIEYILKDSKVKLLLTNSITLSKLPDSNFKTINLDNSTLYDNNKNNLKIKQNKEDLCYLIYTSGSTGTPKGVMLKKGSVMNLVNYCNNYIQYLKNPSYRSVVSVTTVSFDIFMFETLISLQKGLKLVIADENAQTDSSLLNDIFKKENIEIMQTTPSRMKLLINNHKYIPLLKKLKYVTLAGEQLPITLVNSIKKISPNVIIYNGYGPSETTVFSTLTDITNHSEITIGKPLDNTKIYILDNNKNLCPIGIPGELYISGDGVGKGYINKPDLTKSSFIKDVFNPELIMYKSGDIGFYKDNGEIVCLGRSDSQVKIRGLRIELEEIEQVLIKISNILDCCVIKKELNNREFLCAYYTKQGPVDENTLRKLLRKKLPQYMVPQYFIELEKLPYTPNGKVDRKSLPEPILRENIQKEESRNKTDLKLLEIIASVLNIKNVNISDDILNLGADSLTAINLSTKIYETFKVKIFVKDILDNTKISDLSDFISNLSVSKTNEKTIKKAENKKYYPLSSAQRRIYYTSKMIGEQNIVYNTPGAILIDTILDKTKVQKCFNKIIKNQASFRTSFVTENGEIKQKISSSANLEILTFENSSSEISNLVNNFAKPFDLSKAPLLRIELHYIDNCKTLLLLDSHHIIMDGTSLNILIKDFCNLYNNEKIDDLEIEYTDFSVWENKYLKTKKIEESKNYWINKFVDSEIPSINLPYDYNMPTKRSYEGNTVSNILNPEDFEKYIDFAQKLGISPYMFFISAFFVLLYKYTGQNEILLGTPTSGRTNTQLENIIGMFVNNIVIDGKIDSNSTFKDFANSIKAQILEDLTYQDYPYDLLVKDLNITNSDSSNPLFDVMFTYQNTDKNKLILDNKSAEIQTANLKISKFNLSVEINPNTRTINFEYRTDLFKKDTVKRFYEHYINTLNKIISNEDITIKDISIISETEKNIILNQFNNTHAIYPKNKTVIEIFEEQVQKNPNKTALVFDDKKLTYRQLNEKANQLAHYIEKQGFKPDDIICILLDKSLEMIIAILAILKNRCAYLPIDITYPEERIDYIIKDSKSKLLLTSRNINISNYPIKSAYIDLDNTNIYNSENSENIIMERNSSDLAYVMYTSGSTGAPKGVMIENKSILRLIINNNYIKFQKTDRILQTGSIVFDACTFEIWGAFFNGLPLYIMHKEDLLDSNVFSEYILKNKISVLWLTAPLFNQLCENTPHMFRTIRCLLTGGDVLSPKHINMAKTANPNLTIINGYGPTENTTFSCCYEIDKKYNDAIPIGGPIANSTCYVVSKDNNLQPIGIPGELWVGGDGVARGYFNNESLTSEKFINSEFSDSKIYKTGDLVKWNKDGYLEFLGRIDTQIKIRGFRVELSEISSTINSYDGIKESYTIFDTINNEKAICSYVVSRRKINFEDLKKYLSNHLPKYMIPKYFMQLDKLPINQNGKVNKKLLPRDFNTYNNNAKIVLPESDLENSLYRAFCETLKISEFSITDNFFDLGGDSISAMKLQINALRENVNITYSDIFEYPTILSLAKYIESNQTKNTKEIDKNTYLYNYDNIIKNNKIKNITQKTNTYTPIGNVLLTGLTGFLGSHILDSFIKNETGTIYCLIRPKNNISSKDRLLSTLNFYFGSKYNKLIDDRIICIEGDITKSKLGLSSKQYEELGNTIDTVIHSAALVKHFGNYSDFEKINVGGTKQLIEFSKDFDCRLMHISTLSVSGNNFAEGSFIENNITEEINYDETKFYIGQNLENLYVKSKFLAENLVFDAINDGLKAYVLRMGNLTSRFSEGKFQQNHLENAFVNRIKSLLQIGYVPEYMKEGCLEFTPIDYCADAIINIANHYNKKFSVFHVLNDNYVKMVDLYNILKKLGIDINIVSSEEFNNVVNGLLQSDEGSEILSGIIRDFNSDKKLVYNSNIKINSDFTKEFLKINGFEWPLIDIKYLRKYFKYLIQIGYLNIDIKED